VSRFHKLLDHWQIEVDRKTTDGPSVVQAILAIPAVLNLAHNSHTEMLMTLIGSGT